MKNVVIFSYASFNWRRYSRPWLCRMTERGGDDFNAPSQFVTRDKLFAVPNRVTHLCVVTAVILLSSRVSADRGLVCV